MAASWKSVAKTARLPPMIGASWVSVLRCSTVFSQYGMETVGLAGARVDMVEVAARSRCPSTVRDTFGQRAACDGVTSPGIAVW